MMKVGRAIKNMEFTEEDEVFAPHVEKSFYQEMPDLEKEKEEGVVPHTVKIDVWEVFNNKLEEVDIYKRFLEVVDDTSVKQLPRDIFAYAKECDAAAIKKQKDDAEAKKAAAKRAARAAKKERRRLRKKGQQQQSEKS